MAAVTSEGKFGVLGYSFSTGRTTAADGIVAKDPSVPGAKTGTLTTRTDNDTGVFAMQSGHGFSNGNKVDVFWGTGYRRAMDATVSGDNVTLDGGTGDNLPAVGTAVTAMVPQSEAFVVGHADLRLLAVGTPGTGRQALAAFLDSGGSLVRAVPVYEATGAYLWEPGDPAAAANPFGTTNGATVALSHGGTAATTVLAAALVN